jgi:mRNA interferase RelE/StbE
MKFEVRLTRESKKDFEGLDGSIKEVVLKKLIKLESNPFLGKPLGNKAGIDLTGYYKLYVSGKGIRIVYQVIEQKLIISFISIGKREDLSAYYLAYLRKK